MPRQKKQKASHLASNIRKLTRKIYNKRGFPEGTIVNNWPLIVGESLASVTIPERLTSNGTLQIRVSGPQVTEFAHMETEILEQVATYYGYRAANKLSFIQGPIKNDANISKIERKKKLQPSITPDLLKLVNSTRNTQLKDALRSLGHKVTNKNQKDN
jgi:hypothetical protein|tara:strand:- start:252 stop:725 length:474 start_codon:yes stop_codon:yes gene_type:complete